MRGVLLTVQRCGKSTVDGAPSELKASRPPCRTTDTNLRKVFHRADPSAAVEGFLASLALMLRVLEFVSLFDGAHLAHKNSLPCNGSQRQRMCDDQLAEFTMMNKLRTHAELRIKDGTAPLTRGWTTATEALTLLHRLASAPESASDALRLLHELQVLQVELDLQQEQAEEDGLQLAEDLKNFTVLFESAPFAYLTLDPEGLVMAANRAAVDWLAAQTGQTQTFDGRRIEDFLTPECGAAVRGMFDALRKGQGRQTCTVQATAGGASVQAVAMEAPDGERVLLAFAPAQARRVGAGS